MPGEHHNARHDEPNGASSAGRHVQDDRAVGAVVGLAIGDAAGWPARQHRSHALPAWTRRLRRELDTFAEEHNVTSLPVPFALNQDVTPLRFGPSDDAEWAAWTLTWLNTARPAGGLGQRPGTGESDWSRERVHAMWLKAAESDGVPRGRISVATAVDALRRGVLPPRTGHDNPHHFDDAAAIRAVAIGAMIGDPDPDHAADVAEWDAEVTNAGDGVLAARAIARTIASLPVDPMRPRRALLSELPEHTLIGRTTRTALDAVTTTSSPAEAIPLLDDVVDRVYSYGTAAAQTVAVAAALADVALRAGTPSIEAVTAAACLSSLADSAPALTGALVGAARGASSFPDSWVQRCRTLVGCCAPSLARADLLELVKGSMGEQ
ncbi:ADP-ribosylglycohydrolase family protein [Phytoactinopolyspora halotolerans]|uniref:ADP-ribosylglycohydrolase family protein n=1 Tax=Phytoactinopolyspora halotolerans TaxID=1981512 RepID=A0A6L9S7I3_9ACTN|nr:ADP-ribosylglycohydrolase family protein [Phytoactinopolyspora halotolerans]NEE00957.1 hypothetical protein [Phytoactinopolyspora halotolerans]